MDVVEQPEAQHLADAGHGLPQMEGGGVMVPGGVDDGEFDVAKSLIVVGTERQINCNTLLDGWIGKALGTPLAVRFVGDLLANGRQGILAVGILHVCQELGPFVCQMPAAPSQGTGGAHAGGIDRGLREHAATEQGGNLLRIHFVIFGLPAMDGFHVQGMTEDKRDAFVGTEVGEPVPGEHAFDSDDETLAIRSNDVQEGIRVGFHVTRPQNLAAL